MDRPIFDAGGKRILHKMHPVFGQLRPAVNRQTAGHPFSGHMTLNEKNHHPYFSTSGGRETWNTFF
jgi:hypothetical protein